MVPTTQGKPGKLGELFELRENLENLGYFERFWLHSGKTQGKLREICVFPLPVSVSWFTSEINALETVGVGYNVLQKY